MAILRHLIGRTGRVTAIEFDPGLMARLERNFANARNVRVVQGDGTRVAFDPAQLIYVNAGSMPAQRGRQTGCRHLLDVTGNATAGSRAVGGDCRICLKKSHQLFRFPDLRLDKFLRKHLARPSRVERKGVKKRCLSL